MSERRLVLGLDSSTQSLTAVLVDIKKRTIVAEHSLSYKSDPRLSGFGFEHESFIVPPREPGEADQPPRLFLASLDAILSDLKAQGVSLSEIAAINVSGQQHGHVYLGPQTQTAFMKLRAADSQESTLVELIGDVFSYGTAPIWKTSNTAAESAELREAMGGRENMIRASGSDSPLRFTAAVIRRVGKQFPTLYEKTGTILLISNFIPAILCGNHRVGIDIGNGAGTSLMNYSGKTWDKELLAATAAGLPGGVEALQSKLPPIVHPLDTAGTIAPYFINKYGFNPCCQVMVGSGDNPQTKVLFDGDLLSLGTSFVMMASTTEGTVDLAGYANAMYDGLGRPFCFGCRTNGALVWDRVRLLHGLSPTDYAACEQSLASVPLGTTNRLWQPDTESFPFSAAFGLTRKDSHPADFNHDYAGVVDSSLVLLWYYSQGFAPSIGTQASKPLYLSGGPSANKEIVKRVAAIWNRPTIVIGKAGAAIGAAAAAAIALAPQSERDAFAHELCTALVNGAKPVLADKKNVDAMRGTWVNKLIDSFKNLQALSV